MTHLARLAALSTFLLVVGVGIAGAAEPKVVSFNGVEYLHRWSKDGQHEYTPKGQEDLHAWSDMVTLNLYDKVTTGDALASYANNTLENYTNHRARVLRTDSVPRTKGKEAEHLIVVLFPQPKFIEAVFARFMIAKGKGASLIYSHRIHGEKSGPAASEWLKANGPSIEKKLMSWKAEE